MILRGSLQCSAKPSNAPLQSQPIQSTPPPSSLKTILLLNLQASWSWRRAVWRRSPTFCKVSHLHSRNSQPSTPMSSKFFSSEVMTEILLQYRISACMLHYPTNLSRLIWPSSLYLLYNKVSNYVTSSNLLPLALRGSELHPTLFLPTAAVVASLKTSALYLTYSTEQSPSWEANSFSARKKFPAFYGTRKFITAFTSARHLSLSWASSTQSIPPYPTSWKSILILSSHLSLSVPSGLFPSGFPTKTLYTSLFSPVRATSSAHLILLVMITRTILGEACRSLSFSLCSFLHSPITSSLIIPKRRQWKLVWSRNTGKLCMVLQ